MGAWGEKPFENDSAMDWLAELGKQGVGALRNALREVVDTDGEDYLEVDEGSAAIAAAELVSAAQGHGREYLVEAAVEWLDKNDGVLGDADVKLARRAVKRVFAENSELRELWDENGEDGDWHKEVRALQTRLKG
jgi:hypothetical protein